MGRAISQWLARLWDFIDDRDIDKHLISMAIMYGTIQVTEWAMRFASLHGDSANGAGTAAIIAAVTTPYMVLQAAAIGFYFNIRGSK